ncbi:MAG: hypothetical protein Q6352_006115 [Candidatus Freyrarchaeum guaymaensis]
MVHKLEVYTPPWPIIPKVQKKNDKKIAKAAKSFYNSLKTRKPHPSPSLYNLIRFKFLKTASKDCKKYLPADYKFYKDKKNYYYDTKISVLKNAVASLLTKIAFFMMRDIGPAKKK